MSWKLLSNNKQKHIVQNTETGEIKVIMHDQAYNEALGRGDLLQPIGKDKDKWLEKHPDYYINNKGELTKK